MVQTTIEWKIGSGKETGFRKWVLLWFFVELSFIKVGLQESNSNENILKTCIKINSQNEHDIIKPNHKNGNSWTF